MIFHPDVLDRQAFMAICPSADDIWLYFMAGRTGACWKVTSRYFKPVAWMGSQEENLTSRNVDDGYNDVQFANMIERYGFEWALR